MISTQALQRASINKKTYMLLTQINHLHSRLQYPFCEGYADEARELERFEQFLIMNGYLD